MDAVRNETPAAYGLCLTLPRISARLLRAAAAGGFFMRRAGIPPLRRSACRTVRVFYNTLRRMVDPLSKALVCASPRSLQLSGTLLPPLATPFRSS